MQIVSVLLLSRPNFPKDYSLMPCKELSDENIWLKIYEECNKHNKKYVKHFVNRYWTPTPNEPNYEYKGSFETQTLSIPVGNLVYNLEIFMQ